MCPPGAPQSCWGRTHPGRAQGTLASIGRNWDQPRTRFGGGGVRGPRSPSPPSLDALGSPNRARHVAGWGGCPWGSQPPHCGNPVASRQNTRPAAPNRRQRGWEEGGILGVGAWWGAAGLGGGWMGHLGGDVALSTERLRGSRGGAGRWELVIRMQGLSHRCWGAACAPLKPHAAHPHSHPAWGWEGEKIGGK